MKQFGVMIKPVGSVCNMRCRYCYYISNNMSHHHRMDEETLGKAIVNTISSNSGPVVSFVWHGGEPTLAGLEFYRKAVEIQKKHLPKGWQCWNNLQTNGLLLDEQWCKFVAQEHFDVGLSIDGTELIHDRYRHDAEGNPTYERIASNVRRLQKHGVQPDLLCTVTSDTALHPQEVYETLAEFNTGWIQFIPIVNRSEDGYTPESVSPEQYGRFLCKVFDCWVSNIGKCDVQLFMEMLNIYAGGQPSLCWLAETCGVIPVIESDGMVYSCDHFVNEDHILGSVMEDRLDHLMTGKLQTDFALDKKEAVCEDCRNCPWWFICHGACPKDRVAGKYYLCEGLKMLFEHADVPLRHLVQQMRKGSS
ncbi:MAG: anaerobic sulfatase maturase [Erysipelotrichaceae bacterium]|nr:anaerobic sulfatase maturase [Erysipelotrichaceae bacterium]